MQKILILLLCLVSSYSLLATKKKVSKNVTIKGQITKTSDYCGGARPSDEMRRVLSTPQGLENAVIYIKIGTSNSPYRPVFKKITTDKKGNFTVVLKSGTTYSFYEEWKGKPLQIPADTEHTKWDAKCFEERYMKPDYIIKVKNNNNAVVKINFHVPCFYRPYCGEYSGPIPP